MNYHPWNSAWKDLQLWSIPRKFSVSVHNLFGLFYTRDKCCFVANIVKYPFQCKESTLLTFLQRASYLFAFIIHTHMHHSSQPSIFLSWCIHCILFHTGVSFLFEFIIHIYMRHSSRHAIFSSWWIILVTPCLLTRIREFIHTQHRNTTRGRRPSVVLRC